MAPPTIPTTPPTTLVAGASAVWDDAGFTLADYGTFRSSDGWTLTYDFVGVSGLVEVTAATQDTGWRTTLTSAQTLQLRDGSDAETQTVRWVAWATSGTDRIAVAKGSFALEVDQATLTDGYESPAASLLRVVRSAITALVTNGIKSAQIQGRAYTKNDLGELKRLEKDLLAQVWREAHPGDFAAPIYGRFECPS